MKIELIHIGLAFLEGFALIISPCILPILPIIFSGSLTGGKKRPFGIITGFILLFTLFTFLSRTFIQTLGLDLNLIRYISFALLLILGILMMSTVLTEKFTQWTQRLSRVGSSVSIVNNPQGGFLSGLLFGGLIAIIWTPCAGPILAAVIVQTVMQQTSLNSYLTVLFFAIGAGVPMLLITLLGRKIIDKFSFFRTRAHVIRKLLGLVIIASVIFMVMGDWFLQAVKQAREAQLRISVTPTISLGYNNNTQTFIKDKSHSYSYPTQLKENAWALKGDWIVTPNSIIATSAHAMLKVRFYSDTVNMLMNTASYQPIKIKIKLNGEKVISEKGDDVVDSTLIITKQKLYKIISRKHIASGVLEIEVLQPGLECQAIMFDH